MRINGSKPAGLSALDGVQTSGSMVDQIMEAEALPVNSAKQRRDQVKTQKDEFKTLGNLLSKLQSTADGMKLPNQFKKLTLESSHPDILTGTVDANADVGSYELEIEGLARADKHLAVGFPDAHKTEVGFGFLNVGLKGQNHEVIIDPGSTLKDVASKINDSIEGVRASVINTGFKEDPFRLLVSSMETGEEVDIDIDPDTTFLDMKNQVKGQDLKAKFEGVDVKRAGNSLDQLIDGVSLKAAKSAPGTQVTVHVKHDVEKTADGVKEFVKQYNEVQGFGKNQSNINPETNKPGALAGDSTVRQVNRSLQSTISDASLHAVGITTNPKTGELVLDESKLKESLTKDYAGVASIFASTEKGPGLAAKLSEAIKSLQDRATGAVSNKIKGIETRIKNQDQDIARKEERLVVKKAQLERTFANLDSKVAALKSHGDVLNSRLASN